MKEFNNVIYVCLLLVILSLVASCASAPAEIKRSYASIDEMNLLRSTGNKNFDSGQSATPGISGEDSENISRSASAAPSLPDLIVQSISGLPALPRKIESGSSFTVITKIKNKGKAQADSQSIEQYYLSANKSYSLEDILLIGSRTVPTLQPKQYSDGSATVSIPSSTPSGKYYLISCADDMKNIIEKNEKNNCKATRKIQVTTASVPSSIPISIPLDYNEQVTQGLSTDISFPVNLSGPANYTSISLNLQDILSNSVTITPGLKVNSMVAEAQSPISMYMYIRIGAFANTVCQDGLRYGPFFIGGSSSSPTANPPSASAEPSTVNIINSGSFAMCIQVVSDTDASIHVDTASIDATECNQPPANIGGTWTGTYTCINHNWPNDIDHPITLTITQDGNRAQYIDDGEYTYEGTVCGNVFQFNRTNPVDFDTESGTFVLNNDGSGTKTSTWISISRPDTWWGNCTDNLHRL